MADNFNNAAIISATFLIISALNDYCNFSENIFMLIYLYEFIKTL